MKVFMFGLQIFLCVFIRGKLKKGNICPLSPLAKATEGKPVKNFTPGLLQNYVSVYERVTSHPSGINRANILLAAVYSFIIFFMRRMVQK
jgi:hypothetical protein